MRKILYTAIMLGVCSFLLAAPAGYQKAEVLGTIREAELGEISGIATSHYSKNLFWVHNDSGDGAKIYAVDRKGKLRGKVLISNARAFDWEDMARGTFEEKKCLFIGDIGDNGRIRKSIEIYILPEPFLKELSPEKVVKKRAIKTLHLTYPDGAHNAEALLIDGRGNLYIWEKTPSRYASLYRALKKDMEKKSKIELKKLGTVDLKPISGRRSKRGYQITAGDFSPRGRHMVLRGYRWAAELAWPYRKNSKITKIRIPREPQGEAITYRTSNAIVITSEKTNQPLYQLKRRSHGR